MKVLIVLALFGAVAIASPLISIGGSLAKVQQYANSGIAKAQNVTGAILGLRKVVVSAPLSATKGIVSDAVGLGTSAAKFGGDAAKKAIGVSANITNTGMDVVSSMGLSTIARFGKKIIAKTTDMAGKVVDSGVSGINKTMGMVNSTAHSVLDTTLAANEKLCSVVNAGNAKGHAFATNMVNKMVNMTSSFGQMVGNGIASAGNVIANSSALTVETSATTTTTE